MPPGFCIMQPKLRCHIRTRVTWEESSFVASNVINVSFKCKRIWHCLDFQIRKRRWESQRTRKRYWQTCKVSHSKGKKKKNQWNGWIMEWKCWIPQWWSTLRHSSQNMKKWDRKWKHERNAGHGKSIQKVKHLLTWSSRSEQRK